uniref:Uperin-2.7 n=1 Tax=Uperoleia mjobergii TaxID=104954 RepID=UPE27_UPEMJ|nr:RecName: Full=Uperin-2.7 [Uperoleia mjobergii]
GIIDIAKKLVGGIRNVLGI